MYSVRCRCMRLHQCSRQLKIFILKYVWCHSCDRTAFQVSRLEWVNHMQGHSNSNSSQVRIVSLFVTPLHCILSQFRPLSSSALFWAALANQGWDISIHLHPQEEQMKIWSERWSSPGCGWSGRLWNPLWTALRGWHRDKTESLRIVKGRLDPVNKKKIHIKYNE